MAKLAGPKIKINDNPSFSFITEENSSLYWSLLREASLTEIVGTHRIF